MCLLEIPLHIHSELYSVILYQILPYQIMLLWNWLCAVKLETTLSNLIPRDMGKLWDELWVWLMLIIMGGVHRFMTIMFFFLFLCWHSYLTHHFLALHDRERNVSDEEWVRVSEKNDSSFFAGSLILQPSPLVR